MRSRISPSKHAHFLMDPFSSVITQLHDFFECSSGADSSLGEQFCIPPLSWLHPFPPSGLQRKLSYTVGSLLLLGPSLRGNDKCSDEYNACSQNLYQSWFHYNSHFHLGTGSCAYEFWMQIQLTKGNKELRLFPQKQDSHQSITKMLSWELNLCELWQLLFSVSLFANNSLFG